MSNAAVAIAAYRATLSAPLRQVTLCVLVHEGQVLLALKKRGFGAGKWTGVGGKPLPGESIEAAARRETHEEIGVTVSRMEQVATLNFYFPHLPIASDWNQQAHVYLVHAWMGDPDESDEVAPRWFERDALPYAAMWDDARFWLPRALSGERFTADFLFDATNAAVAALMIVPGE